MRLISSPRATFFYKKVRPVLWFLFASGLGIYGFFAVLLETAPDLLKWIYPIVVIVFLWFQTRKFGSELADEVWLEGETLIVKSNGEEARIAGAMLRWVDRPDSMTASMVFKSRTPFGLKIVFMPKMEGFRGSHNGVVEELQEIQRRHR